jgi:acyl-coenzyme A synthetase/AMP-(fatty) acid ligase
LALSRVSRLTKGSCSINHLSFIQTKKLNRSWKKHHCPVYHSYRFNGTYFWKNTLLFKLMDQARADLSFGINLEDPALLHFTSGTTDT